MVRLQLHACPLLADESDEPLGIGEGLVAEGDHRALGPGVDMLDASLTAQPFDLDDIEQVPHLALSVNKRGWAPFRRQRSARTIAIAPSIGSPDSLTEALGAWRDAAWLEPGATREWRLTWSAGEVEAPEPPGEVDF